ncbi:TPA_asm: hypothetical protein ES702_05919 [Lokiarchaeia virus SkuldV3]|uniref:Uncharacterized protein n=1 Tax=Lokiarchaeia virus SkuldV3 TaxID=2983915 RepID=A0A9N6YJU2_9VIRU|nr:hypothetical protein QKT74_gp16 [Lokiarchaeia virus SkuldV3]DAZ90956.1 TPA_asm: hypothetical protein ES702_05919 [Lokiarchaeia virus SkuldV3]
MKKIIKIKVGLKETKIWYSKKYFKSKKDVIEHLAKYFKFINLSGNKYLE